MKLTQHLRRKISLAWVVFKKFLTSVAEQTVRHAELMRLSFETSECKQRMDGVFERVGRFFYESQGKGLDTNSVAAHQICQSGLAEYKRLQIELNFIEQKRSAFSEEDVITQWGEFIESAHKSGMFLGSLTLPSHLELPSLTLQQLALPQEVLVIAIQRKERFIQTNGSVPLYRGDRLTLLGPPPLIAQVMKRFSSARSS